MQALMLTRNVVVAGREGREPVAQMDRALVSEATELLLIRKSRTLPQCRFAQSAESLFG